MVRNFQELVVWQKAHALVLDVYGATNHFPRSEMFGVTAQIRRSVASVPANIAEGFARRSTKEFLQALGIANGSLEETRYFLILGRDLRYLPPGDFRKLDEQCTSVAQLLAALVRALKNRTGKASHVSGSRNTDHGARTTAVINRQGVH